MSKTFCVLPFMSLATNASGNLRVCCNVIPGTGFIRKPNGQIYNISRDDMKEAWNSEVYQTLRQQMLDGERPEMCARCFKEEDAGIRSSRMAWNNTNYFLDEDLPVDWHLENSPFLSERYQKLAPFEIKYVDLRLGNLCNLKCRMCNPYASNLWVKEWPLVNELGMPQSEYDRLSKMDWPEKEKTWENLFDIAHTVEEIYLTGGEPTVIQEQRRLLDYFIDNGTAKDIRLKYNTNLVKVPDWLIEKWSHFKKVKLNCSIDAVGDLDHYIRYPSKWPTIEKNFTKLSKLDNTHIEIHCTVQMYNMLRLPELFDWAEPFGYKIYMNILNHPDYLNIQCLPEKLKHQAEKQLQPYLDKPKVADTIKYMWAKDWTEKLPEFYKYTLTLDKSRNEDLYSIVPEFKEYEQ